MAKYELVISYNGQHHIGRVVLPSMFNQSDARNAAKNFAKRFPKDDGYDVVLQQSIEERVVIEYQ